MKMVMQRRFCFLATVVIGASVWGVGCGEDAPPPPPQAATAEGVQTETAPLAIGYDRTPEAPPAGAMRALKSGGRLLKRGDAAGARTAWEAIVRDHPDYQMARYHVAKAMAQSGSFEEARVILDDLLERDLPRYRRRFITDDVMAGLRNSPQGAQLQARITELDAAYRAAASRGIPMMMTRPGHGQPVRGGVWVHEERRFLPLGQEMRNSHSALVDVELGRSISVAVGRRAGSAAVRIYLHPLYGESGSPGDVQIAGVRYFEVEPTDTGARFRYSLDAQWDDEALPPDVATPWLDLTHGYNARAIRTYNFGPAQGRYPYQGASQRWYLSGGNLFPPNAQVRIAPWRVRTNGWRFVGNRIEHDEGRRIELSRGHGVRQLRYTLPSADGNALIAWSNRGAPPCSHIIDHVDLQSGTVTQIHAGDGNANVRFAADGALYIQTGAQTRRLAPGSYDFGQGELVMSGVNLGTLDCRLAGARFFN